MLEIVIRPALGEELPAAARVYVAADDESDLRLYGRSLREVDGAGEDPEAAALADLSLFHAEAPEQVLVAVSGEGQVVGLAAAVVRGRHWHLVYLFVLPGWQNQGVGRALLEQSHRAGVAAGCDRFTLCASDEPAALTRYLRLGLAPGPPVVVFQATAPTFPGPRWDDGLVAQPLTADDDAIQETIGDIDALVRGARRRSDHRRWLAEGAVGALLSHHQTGVPAGYFLIDPSAHPARIGPVAVNDREWMGAVLGRALSAADAHHQPGLRWRVDAPGENIDAIGPLLAAGFRPARLANFFASGPIGRFDRYVLHDQDLL